jgi:hypothetical protein
MKSPPAIALLLALALAACGRGDDDPDSSGVTPAEKHQLDQAAAATDINATTANASEPAQ